MSETAFGAVGPALGEGSHVTADGEVTHPEADEYRQARALPTDPAWFKRAVFYEVLVRAFNDSTADGSGDLRGLTAKLDYLAWLGVDCLWLPPFYDSPLRDGWFPTGDIATIDAQGVMQIRDRAKDLIKTGGEWISSLDLENAACTHPAVLQAAVIGVQHPKWQERPLMFVVRRPNIDCCREDILEFLASRVARWWLPEEVIFLDALPVGGTGKVQKTVLREKYGNVFS